jgi:hypothetical protein
LDLGGGEIGFGAVPTSAVVVNGNLDFHRGWFNGRATGGMYRFGDDTRRSGFGSALLTVRPPRRPGFSGELVAFGSATNHHSFYRARRVEGKVGVLWAGTVMEGALRWGVSQISNDGASLTPTRVEVEARRVLGPATVTLFGARSSFRDSLSAVRDTTYIVAGFPFRSRYQTAVSLTRAYLDAEARVQWRVARSAWTAAVGARRGDATLSNEQWQRLDLTLPLARGISLIATGGRRPAVPEERLPGGAFAVVGLKVAFHDEPLSQPGPADSREAPRLVALDLGGGERSISLIGLQAKRVEIMADFTDWQAVELASLADGVWHVNLRVGPGAHRISIRVDGQQWMPPPGLPVTTDEFMGTVGILLIE